jgi:hypothetical protein
LVDHELPEPWLVPEIGDSLELADPTLILARNPTVRIVREGDDADQEKQTG